MNDWHYGIPGWPIRGPIDTRAVEPRMVSVLGASALPPPWLPGSTWRVVTMFLLAPDHADLAEPPLRGNHDRVGAWFDARARAQRAASPASTSGEMMVAVVCSCDEGAPAARLQTADWLWTMQVRRLQWLRERHDVLAACSLTPWDLSDLDELYETEYHYARSRIERGVHDGGAAVLVVARLAEGSGSR